MPPYGLRCRPAEMPGEAGAYHHVPAVVIQHDHRLGNKRQHRRKEGGAESLGATEESFGHPGIMA